MASKSTNKTVWTLALVGIAVFLAWKLWPDLKKLLNPNSSGGGASGGVGASSPYPYEPNYGQQGSGSGAGLSFGPGSGSNSGLKSQSDNGTEPEEWGPLGNLWNWISGQETAQGDQAVENLSTESDFSALGTLDEQGLPLYPDQASLDANPPGFDLVDLPSWSANDPNAPWNNDSSDASSYQSPDTISADGDLLLTDTSGGGGYGINDGTSNGGWDYGEGGDGGDGFGY